MPKDKARPASRAEPAPVMLWAIALIALAPFPIAALVYGYGAPDLASPALTVLLTWSAVVVAFFGGVRWGLETAKPRPRWPRLALSALSSFIAWGVLLSRGRIAETWVLGAFIVVFMVQWLFDHQAPGVPARYPRLFTVLTGGACVSLALALEKAIHT